MSKIGCVCGHTIRDQTDQIPYKASLLQDIHESDYWEWVEVEVQSYLEAAEKNDVGAWMKSRGWPPTYAVGNGRVLRKILYARYVDLMKSVFECESCGRLLVEGQANEFQHYSPDTQKFNAVLAVQKR